MSLPTDVSKPTKYTCVIRLVDHYLAVHVNNREKSFISESPEKDLLVAQTAAKTFAESNQISYYLTARDIDKPIITIYKYENHWYPLELHSDRMTLITGMGELILSGTQQDAINSSQGIALIKKTDCIPSIGISMSSKN